MLLFVPQYKSGPFNTRKVSGQYSHPLNITVHSNLIFFKERTSKLSKLYAKHINKNVFELSRVFNASKLFLRERKVSVLRKINHLLIFNYM